MKHLFLILNLIFVAVGVTAKNDGIDSMFIVKPYDWHVLVCSPVSCSSFEKDVELKGRVVKDEQLIKGFIERLQNLPETTRFDSPLCKVYMYKEAKIVSSLCINMSHCLYDGAVYAVSKEFREYIDRIYNSGHLCDKTMQIVSKKNIMIVGADSLKAYVKSRLQGIANDTVKTSKLVLILNADSEGNTIEVKFPGKSTFLTNDVKKNIRDFIVVNVKWNKNPERTSYDDIYVKLKW